MKISITVEAYENLSRGSEAVLKTNGKLYLARFQDPGDLCYILDDDIEAGELCQINGNTVSKFQEDSEYQEMNPHDDALDSSKIDESERDKLSEIVLERLLNLFGDKINDIIGSIDIEYRDSDSEKLSSAVTEMESKINNPMTINALCKKAFENSKAKGFYDNGESKAQNGQYERNFGEFIALVHSELSEALEHQRKGREGVWLGEYREESGNADPDSDVAFEIFEKYLSDSRDCKPDGILIELADAVIRIFDYCGSKNWNLEGAIKLKMAFNESRPYKHGKKF